MQSTTQHCECGWLGSCLNDPNVPVGYDPQSNSFYFAAPDRMRLMLYFCPMCGGKFSDSDYQTDVPIAPEGEYQRLKEHVADLNTPDTAIQKLGEPDYDGLMKTYLGGNGEYSVDESISSIRNIEYYHLSKWYIVELYFRNDGVEQRIVSKFLNACQLEGKFDHPDYSNEPIVGDLDDELLGDGAA